MVHEKTVTDLSTGELKKVNDNFIQFYKDNIMFIAQMNRENSTAVNILFWLIKHMDDNNCLVVSQQAISEANNLTERTVRRCISYLKDVKAIIILKSGSTNVYVTNSEIAWQKSAPQKDFAIFSAKVYISGTEQEQDYKTTILGHAVKKVLKKRGRKPKLTPEQEKSFDILSKKMKETA